MAATYSSIVTEASLSRVGSASPNLDKGERELVALGGARPSKEEDY
jgi:hypothetical protein